MFRTLPASGQQPTFIALAAALILCLGAGSAAAHQTESGWGQAFQKRLTLSDEQYAALTSYKERSHTVNDQISAEVRALQNLLIADAEADISSNVDRIAELLRSDTEMSVQAFKSISETLTDEQRQLWTEHSQKQKDKKSDRSLRKSGANKNK
ncbi:MAG: negative regulator of replication initiation [Alcanivorax sp.]|jgi:negative regulator of replication initiation